MSTIANHLGYWILALAVSLGGLMLLLYLGLHSHRVEEPAEAPPEEKDEGGGELAVAERRPAASGLPGELGLSFLRATQELRSRSSGTQRLYRAPWFLVLGEAGAGKSTLLNALSAPGGGPARNAGTQHGPAWHLFDHGVVLDVPGDYLLRPDTLTAHERSWRGLLRLLNRYRPRRPLDGVVLVLPAHDFTSGSGLEHADLVRKARRLGERLAELQRETGVCFPVYTLVAQCDTIPGFAGYCRALPAERRREMFGWSSPYRADASFESAWVDEAFEQVTERLNRTQSEVFAGGVEGDPAALYFFPGEMMQMRDRLRAFLHQVFRQTAYQDSYHCRGIYFCGSAPPGGAAEAEQAALEAGPEAAVSGGMLGLTLAVAPGLPEPVFVDDLFERKVFPEWGLAYPERRAFAFRRGAALTAETAVLALFLVLATGVTWGTLRLRRLRDQALPVLVEIGRDQASSGAAGGSDAGVGQNAYDLVRSVAELGDDRFVSVFLPASWGGRLDNQIQRAIQWAFENNVLIVLRSDLVQRAQGLGVTAPPLPAAAAAPADPAGDPNASDATPEGASLEQLPQYADLRDYTAQVGALEQNIARYDRISQPGVSGDVGEINQLMKYLHPDESLQIAAGSESYLAQSLEAAHTDVFPEAVLETTRQRVNQGMRERVDALYGAWFHDSPTLAQFQDLTDRIQELRSGSFTYSDLSDLQTMLAQVGAGLNRPESAWMANPNALFQGPLATVTLDPVQRSATLDRGLFSPPADLESYIRDNAVTDWQTLHGNLAQLQTDLTGPVLQFAPNSASLSPGVESLRLPMLNLMNLPFMGSTGAGAYRTATPGGSLMNWDSGALQSAAALEPAYERYVAEGLQEAPSSVRGTFRTIAMQHLVASLNDTLAEAQTFVPAEGNASLDASAANFASAAPQLESLLQTFDRLGQSAARLRLANTLRGQGFELLHGLNAELVNAPPYTALNLTAWDGTRPPSLAGFDLIGGAQLPGYLDYERQRVERLAAAAAPVVTFLESDAVTPTTPGDAEMLAQWRSLTAGVQAYDNKVPGNPVAALEDYIASGMDKTVPASHCQPAPPAGEGGAGDWFLATRARLWSAVYDRCVELDHGSAQRDYTDLADLFNQTLAGRFPFAAANAGGAPAGAEAEPAKLAAFYQALDRDLPALQGQLQGAPAAFIAQMTALRPLWSGMLAAPTPLPAFDVAPTFRVNRGAEHGGNEIIAWTLRVGSQTLQAGQTNPAAHWYLGQPVSLTLQWASDSPQVPGGRGLSMTNPSIRDRSVTFEYDDPWSLFSLLLEHHTPAADLANPESSAPNTLIFVVPTQPASGSGSSLSTGAPATVFVRVAITLPGTVESLRVPEFPHQAPQWNETSRDARDSQ